MAWDAPGAYQYTYPAEADFKSPAVDQYTAKAIGPSTDVAGHGQGNNVALAYADGQTFRGIQQNTAAKGEGVTLMLRGFSRCRCGADWQGGVDLKVGEGGKLYPAASGDSVFAWAAESAVAGDISTCFIK